jgi:hypothetical protein
LLPRHRLLHLPNASLQQNTKRKKKSSKRTTSVLIPLP